MTGITIPDTVTRIEDAAFTGSGLTSVTVPESVTEFGEDVFFLCTKLTEASLPKSLKSIPSETFSNCYKLRSFASYSDDSDRLSRFPVRGETSRA